MIIPNTIIQNMIVSSMIVEITNRYIRVNDVIAIKKYRNQHNCADPCHQNKKHD